MSSISQLQQAISNNNAEISKLQKRVSDIADIIKQMDKNLSDNPGKINCLIMSMSEELENGLKGTANIGNVFSAINGEQQKAATEDNNISEVYSKLRKEKTRCENRINELKNGISSMNRQISDLQISAKQATVANSSKKPSTNVADTQKKSSQSTKTGSLLDSIFSWFK